MSYLSTHEGFIQKDLVDIENDGIGKGPNPTFLLFEVVIAYLILLTQVEEMFIAWVSPILQVMHDRGGHYKYNVHTISFP